MKKFLLVLITLLSFNLFAETFTTGFESIYFPGEITQITWSDETPSTKCYCTKIKPITDGYYELEFTVPVLSNMSATGTYPVVVTYIVKKNSVISMNFIDAEGYLDSTEITIKSVAPNTCEFTPKKRPDPASSSSTSSTASSTTKRTTDSSFDASQYEDWTINKIELIGKRNQGKKIALKNVQVTLLYKTGKVNLWTKNGSISAAYNGNLYDTLYSMKQEYDANFNTGYGNFYGRIILEYGNPVFYIDFIE